MKLKPVAPFAGSSDLMNALAFFADSPGVKRALVVFPNDLPPARWPACSARMGYDVDIATNGRQANLLATSNGDYELALLSSRIDKPPVWVLIQQLRHDPQCPIADRLYGRGCRRRYRADAYSGRRRSPGRGIRPAAHAGRDEVSNRSIGRAPASTK